MLPCLQAAQEELYALLLRQAPAGFFLHRAKSTDCLWVSDLPRRISAVETEAVTALLTNHDFCCAASSAKGLLSVDFSIARYEVLLTAFPTVPPPIFPLLSLAEYHPAYALCRFLLLHPAPFSQQPLAPLREMLKVVCSADSKAVFHLIPRLHGECAQWLRAGAPLPSAAGQVLSSFLATQCIPSVPAESKEAVR